MVNVKKASGEVAVKANQWLLLMSEHQAGGDDTGSVAVVPP
jgi:hypothetical protein